MKLKLLSLFLSLSVAHGLLLGAADSIPVKPGILKVSRLEKLLQSIEQTELNYQSQFHCNFSDQLAEQKFQELGREAQNALQISVARQVPIKVLPASDVGVRIAAVSRSAIYIDQEALSNFSYGYQRAVFFHEAAHIKYGDNSLLVETAIKSALFLSGSISSAVMSTRLSHNISPRISVLLFGAGTVASGFAARQLDLDSWAGKRRERRADVQAYSAMQCALCMQECAQDQQSRGIAKGAAWVQKNRDHGYLMPEEMMTIADYYKKQNKVCAYHSNNQIIPSKL